MASKANFKLEGIDDLVYGLRYVGKNTDQAGRMALRESAGMIRDTAREYAPVLDHDLERSIRVANKNFRADEFGGEYESESVDVGVDMSVTKSKRPDTTVGEYADKMHSGGYKLGPKSRAKAVGRLAGKVGPGFLDRAVKVNLGTVKRKIEQAVRIAVASANRRRVAARKGRR